MPEVIIEYARREQNVGSCKISSQPKKLPKLDANWLYLPYELWLSILVDYGVTGEDLVNLEYTCKWFSNCWGGGSVTEEAARLIIKKHRNGFGELTNRVIGASWKEKLYNLEKIVARMPVLATGSYQNITIIKGHVFTWGAGRFGQLGNTEYSDKLNLQDVTRLVPPEAGNIVQVSAGCGHTGLITENGHAYTFGDGRYKQLGHTEYQGQTCAMPTRICKELSNKRCLQIACGSCHTLFLTDMGQVYVTGLGDSGQLGLGPGRGVAIDPTPLVLPNDEYNIVFVTAGIAHNILLTNCGKVFTFGLSSVGQLGHGGTKNLHQPTQVSVLREKKIVYATAGVSHSIFLDSSGHAYTCGKGKGLLGHGENRIRTVPTKVESLEGVKIVRAAAGVARSIFISSDGFGYWCGEGMGELKNHTATLPTVMRLPEPLHSASLGNSHIVLQMKSGRVMSMGNNGRFQTGIQSVGATVSTFTNIDVPS